MPNVNIWYLTGLAVSLNATLNECLKFVTRFVIQGHWLTLDRSLLLLRVALSEISGLGPKWSFATDTQHILLLEVIAMDFPTRVGSFRSFWYVLHISVSDRSNLVGRVNGRISDSAEIRTPNFQLQ